MMLKSNGLEICKGKHPIPAIITSRTSADILEMVRLYGNEIKVALVDEGALLLRGFQISDEGTLARVFEQLWESPIRYLYRSTPRTTVSEGVYTATEYPPDREIPMHCENAYQHDWPMRIGFHCLLPSTTGGETPIADVERVTAKINSDVIAEFRARKVCYVRNYSDFVDLPWKDVFQSNIKREVEEYCRSHGIEYFWTPDGLTTRQVCQGTAIHPKRNLELWFNQAHLFHISSLGDESAAEMIDVFGKKGLPRNAYFGDGGEIPDSTMAHVREAFSSEKITFSWHRNDMLLLDNMRMAHGRNTYEGKRRVLVSMGMPFSGCSDRIV